MVDAFLAEHGDMCAALEQVAQRRCEAAVLAVNLALYELGDALLTRYQHHKSEQRAMDFADLEWLAARLMRDEETATYLQVRLDARYRHLLLDEFQDTNPLQWRILQGWLAGYAGLGERPTVFLVGDPKQSIYRFRRADARLFQTAGEMLPTGAIRCSRRRRPRWTSPAARCGCCHWSSPMRRRHRRTMRLATTMRPSGTPPPTAIR